MSMFNRILSVGAAAKITVGALQAASLPVLPDLPQGAALSPNLEVAASVSPENGIMFYNRSDKGWSASGVGLSLNSLDGPVYYSNPKLLAVSDSGLALLRADTNDGTSSAVGMIVAGRWMPTMTLSDFAASRNVSDIPALDPNLTYTLQESGGRQILEFPGGSVDLGLTPGSLAFSRISPSQFKLSWKGDNDVLIRRDTATGKWDEAGDAVTRQPESNGYAYTATVTIDPSRPMALYRTMSRLQWNFARVAQEL